MSGDASHRDEDQGLNRPVVHPTPGIALNLHARFFALGIVAGLWLATGVAAAAPIDEIRQLLEREALTAPDPQHLARLCDDALAEGLARIDPYARLIAPMQTDVDDSAPSIGAELYEDAGRLWLLPYVDGPMARQGEAKRVILDAVNGEAVAGLSLQRVGALIAAAGGESLRLALRDSPNETERTATVQPQPFVAPSLEVLSQHPPVLRIRRFVTRQTRAFLAGALQQIPPTQPLRIDLRDARGGDLFEALDSAALFLPPGTLLATTADRAGRKTPYRAPEGPKFKHPLTLEIGPATASAAEIFAGILQDHARARLTGRPSHGKCRSQTEAALSDGSRLRYTNLRVMLPNGGDCEGRGITP